uniref:CUB_2 domain-containing protein n=1 Tax=Caenorhabditis tropicalis TaxID=1561998 RepID=A0A1I7T108_9PELO
MKNFFLQLLISSFFVSKIIADPYNCAGIQTINPPTNISIPWYYPAKWDISQPAPQYAASQNCTWIMNVPKGMFAYLAVKANTVQPSILKMTDSVGYITTIESTSKEQFFVTDPSFRVDLQSFAVGTFGMTVQWYTVNPTIPTTVQIHSKSTPLILFGGDFDNATVIQADTRVSFLVVPPTTLDFYDFLRLTQVYDGPSIASTHIGNLYQFMSSGNNFVSTGNSITFFSLYPGFRTGSGVIFQDYDDVKQFKSYKSINCISFVNNCQFTINARQGTAAAIRYSPTFYVKNIEMPNTNELSVYTDYVKQSHKLADYKSTNTKTNIPQKFNGKLTTFVLDQDEATIQFSDNAIDAKWTSGFDGRRGFFSSPNYGLSTNDQNFSDKIFGVSTSDITYTVDGSSINGDAILNVTIVLGGKTVISDIYTSSRLVGGVVKARGDSIEVQYQTNGSITSGSYVTFRFEKSTSTALNGVFISFIFSIWISLFK